MMGSQPIIRNSGVKWVSMGWTAFIAENLILSENRDVSDTSQQWACRGLKKLALALLFLPIYSVVLVWTIA